MPPKTSVRSPVASPPPTVRSASIQTHSTWSHRDSLCVGLLVGAVLLTYSAVQGCGFVNYDDPQYVTQNAAVLGGLTAKGFQWAWTATYAANWHPLTWLSLMLDRTLFGLEPWGFHLTNVLLHLANTLILFLLLRRLTGRVWRSALVAALFAAHPLHVESVAWISERKDVLSTFFGLLATAAYVRYAQRRSTRRYLVIVLAMVLSLLAKPMWVTLPAVLLLLDYWPLGRWQTAPTAQSESLRKLVIEKLPLVAISLVSCVVTLVVQRSGGALRSLASVTWPERLINAVVSYGEYLRQTFVPVNLACFYPYPHQPDLVAAILIAVLFAAVTGVIVWAGRRYPYLPVGWFWYLGMLVPVIGLVPIGLAARADRYTYVPLIGIFIMLVWGGADLAQRLGRARQIAVLAVGVVCACIVLSIIQIGFWTDSLSLWSHALGVSGDTAIVHCNLGSAYLQQKKLPEGERLEQAAYEFTQGQKFDPDYAPAHQALGEVRLRQGRVDEAVREFQAALRTDPEPARTHADLGQAMLEQGHSAPALYHLQEAARLNPNPQVLDMLAAGYASAGRFDDAVTAAQQALSLARTLGQNTLAKDIQSRLNQYQAKRPSQPPLSR